LPRSTQFLIRTSAVLASASATESPMVTLSGRASFDLDDGAVFVDALDGFDRGESFLAQAGAVVEFEAGAGLDEIDAGLLRVHEGDFEAVGRRGCG
jgi:hypothetical protein